MPKKVVDISEWYEFEKRWREETQRMIERIPEEYVPEDYEDARKVIPFLRAKDLKKQKELFLMGLQDEGDEGELKIKISWFTDDVD